MLVLDLEVAIGDDPSCAAVLRLIDQLEQELAESAPAGARETVSEALFGPRAQA